MAAHQAPPSLRFSRREYWSASPFPSPMHACMLSNLSRVRLCVTLWTAAHQCPLSTGFSRQEYWSGLPFPSPMHESEKWKWSRSVMSDSVWPHRWPPTRLLCPWDSPGKNTGYFQWYKMLTIINIVTRRYIIWQKISHGKLTYSQSPENRDFKYKRGSN